MADYQVGKDIADLEARADSQESELRQVQKDLEEQDVTSIVEALSDLGVIAWDEKTEEYGLGPAFGKKKKG